MSLNSLRILSVLGGSAVFEDAIDNRRDAEIAEVAQRRVLIEKMYGEKRNDG